jgi:TolB protein
VADQDPTWSPDGRWIAFASNRGTGGGFAFQIYIVGANGRHLRRLTHSTGDRPVWSPDGSRIAYLANPGVVGGEIDSIRRDGSGLVRLTRHIGANVQVWSPNGRRMAFAGTKGGALSASSIYVVRADGRVERNLRRPDVDDTDAIAWSPDGTRIAYASLDDGQIHVATVGNRRVLKIPHAHLASEGSPAWSPDGRHLAFRSNDVNDGGPLYIADTNGRSLRAVRPSPSDSGYGDDPPQWLPDGRRLVADGGNGAIYLVDLSRHRLRRIATGLFPIVSPNGKVVVYQRVEEGDLSQPGLSALYSVRIDGTHERMLVRQPRGC